jgi:DNA mismatch endonuclease (patch repair protein)
MQRQPRRDTDIEMQVRRALHRRGLRYRVQVPLLPRRTVDIVFSRARVVVDARSCFWHACPAHSETPKSNADWWRNKRACNAQRDKQTVNALEDAGWSVIVVWAHDDVEQAADRIETLVSERSSRPHPGRRVDEDGREAAARRPRS